MTTRVQRRLEQARELAIKKYGRDYVNLGGDHYRLNVVRTPSLMLDYKLGIGGFPYGHGVEIFGANRLGKSSAIGYGTLANVQREGKLPALLAIEPRMVTPDDRIWGQRLGFNPDMALIEYPDNAEEAFDMLRDLVFGNLVDYIMIDSLGGMGREASAKEDGKKQAFGISPQVTAGLNDIMPRLYKNNIGLLIVNQQRQDTSGGRPGLRTFESPGGEALKHHMRVRIHLKPGANRYTAKIDGEDVLVGRELICVMRKNNLAQAQEKKAAFEFFHIETEQFGFGVDTTQDIINVGKVTGVIQGGAYMTHPCFPGRNHQLHGKPAVRDFLRTNPKATEQIRQDVMTVMVQQELDAAKHKRTTAQTAEVTAVKEETNE